MKISLYFVLLMKSHLESYPCPLNLTFFWNLGFLLGVSIIIQIITGIFLSLHYTSDINSAYFSLYFLIREIYIGWSLQSFHSNGTSFVFILCFIHISRSLFYLSSNTNLWFTGLLILIFLMAIGFIGYVLPFGQMSFWGATVITNLLSPFPSLIEWLCGGHYLYNPTLKRFFLFHFLFPFLLFGVLLLHLFYLHFHSSNNPLKLNTNNKIPFFPFILIKDLFGFILILYLYFIQSHSSFTSLLHPDNALEVYPLVTPLHIVPEWYFLCQYAILKGIPNKHSGFILFLTSIILFFIFGEIYYLITFTLVSHSYNGQTMSFFFLTFYTFSWIGAQFPQHLFLSYGRILTLHYYFLLPLYFFFF